MSNTPRLDRVAEPQKDARRVSWGVILPSIAIVVVGAVVRLIASWDDFWLDEIWSWRFFACAAKSYWQIATQFPHDNNQILNTWIIYSFPLDTHWTIYRIPAVLAGIGTVILAGLTGLKRSTCECITALLLTSGSFVFIQYSSEARGYAYLLFFTMSCIWLMQRMVTVPRARDEWLFGVAASLGVLSHFLFAGAYVGFVCWSMVSVFTNHRSWSARLYSLIRLHVLPILTFGVLAVSYGFRLKSGGGERQRLAGVVIQAVSLAVGGPEADDGAVACFCGAILASLIGLGLLLRIKDGFVTFVVGSTITLTLMIVIAKPESVYARHFLVPVACVILLVSHVLAAAWNSGMWGRGLYVFLIGAILAGNSSHTRQFLLLGRGRYEEAVNFMQEKTKASHVTIGSDHDFRNGLVLEYYFLRLKNPKPLAYFPAGKWPAEGPEWLIRHSFDQPLQNPLSIVRDGAGNQYQLVRIFPYSGLSGWNWILYHRADLERP